MKVSGSNSVSTAPLSLTEASLGYSWLILATLMPSKVALMPTSASSTTLTTLFTNGPIFGSAMLILAVPDMSVQVEPSVE